MPWPLVRAFFFKVGDSLARASDAACAHDVHHSLESKYRIAGLTLNLRISFGKHRDSSRETLLAPALEITLGAIDLPRG